MGDPYRRIGLVDMLAARPAGAVGINLQIGGIDLDIDLIIDLRQYKNRSERGIYRGDTYEIRISRP